MRGVAHAEELGRSADVSHTPALRLADADHAVVAWLDEQLDAIRERYVWFHTHPEVSFKEAVTSARIAGHWRDAGLRVTEGVGGHGVVGILENGAGPRLMLRCDTDALPVTEQTPLPFASKAVTELPGGGTTGVMHACGHDVHMTNLVSVVDFLSRHKQLWQGTLMVIAQPAEERGAGAKAMLEDGLFDRYPKPDAAIALHVSHDTPVGKLKLMPGYAMANVDSVDITVQGRGGHGSAPHTTSDPIVQAASLVMALQTIVSREVNPQAPAVITVGSIHGGTKHNIIGNDCHLQITVRSYDEGVRQQLLTAIRDKALANARLFNAPEPVIKNSEGTPSLRNDDDLAAQVRKAFVAILGEDALIDDKPSMGGEDFSRYGLAGVPILMYRLGTVRQARLDRYAEMGIPAPSLHSAVYYPDFDESIRTGVRSMVAASLSVLAARN